MRVTICAVLLLAGCASTPADTADLLLTGARVYSGTGEVPVERAVAIRGATIVAVGSNEEIRRLASSSTRVIDLGGRLVIPGINDAHVHAPWPTEPAHMVRLPEDPTRDRLLEELARADAEAPAGLALVSELPVSLLDAGIVRDDLDAISTARPIRLTIFGGHAAILNTSALRQWGIEEGAEDPPGGSYGRTDGRLDGWLFEHAYWLPQKRHAATVTGEQIAASVREFEDEALSYGITSVQTMALLEPTRLREILDEMPARLRWRVIDFRMAPYDGSPGKFGVKYILDGTPIERGMMTSRPYADAPETSGTLNYTPEEISAMIRDAAEGNRQLLVHATGDRAIRLVLDAMAATPADWPERRVRIEHGDMITSQMIEQARDLGVILVQNPAHLMLPEVMIARLGAERAGESQPIRSVIGSGMRFAIGSDGPLNPYLNMMFAALHPLAPEERLDVATALRAYTQGSAYAEGEEDAKGRIEQGMAADLAVLNQDIFTVPPDALPATRSVMTIIGGEIVWRTID